MAMTHDGTLDLTKLGQECALNTPPLSMISISIVLAVERRRDLMRVLLIDQTSLLSFDYGGGDGWDEAYQMHNID